MTNRMFRVGFLLLIGLMPFPIAASVPTNAATLHPAATFQAPGRVQRMAASPDGKLLAVGMGDGPVFLLDAPALKSRGRLPKTPPEEPESMAFSPDSGTLAVGFVQGKFLLWKTADRTLARTINGQGFGGSAVAYAPDGKTIKTYTTGGIWAWDPATGAKRAAVQLTGPGSEETSSAAAFSTDAQTLVLAGLRDANHTVYVWDATTGKLRRQFKEQTKLVERLALTARGERLITEDNGDVVRVWQVATGQTVRTWKASGMLKAIAISAEGSLAAISTDSDPQVQVWNLATGRQIAQLPGHGEGAQELLFTPDGRHLYTAAGNTVRFWSLPAR